MVVMYDLFEYQFHHSDERFSRLFNQCSFRVSSERLLALCTAQVLARRLHFNTFGGNPVCSAGGRAVLRAIDEDGVQANSAKVSSTGRYSGGSYCYNRRC